jgi:hypothetical protein
VIGYVGCGEAVEVCLLQKVLVLQISQRLGLPPT